MQKMGTGKIKWSVLFMLALLISMPFPFAYALSLNQIEAIPSSGDASITWTTDKPANSFVNYTYRNGSKIEKDLSSKTNHSISLENLDPKTTYNYQVVSIATEDIREEERSDWRSFTTNPVLEGQLFFNAEIPKFSSGKPLSFDATTNKDAHIVMYVNGIPAASSYADANGTVKIKNLRISRSKNVSIIRVVVGHSDTELTLEQNYTVTLDRTAPTITIDRIPPISTDGTVKVKGDVSELVLIEIFSKEANGQVEEQFSEEVNESFTTTVDLDEGKSTIRMFATDVAGNEVSFTRTIYVDTEAPTILEENLMDLDPTYSPNVEIKGRVDEPNVTVRIYINPDEKGFNTCADNDDNDGDGLVDYLHDPGCSSPDDMSEQDTTVKTECNDGADNDEDGRVDFLEDRGCTSQNDNSEKDYNGSITECNDNLDNDGDGNVDFLSDAGCSSLKDDSEDSDNSHDYEETTADSEGFFSKEITLPNYFSLSNVRLTEAARTLSKGKTGIRDSSDYENSNSMGVEYSSTGDLDDRQNSNLVRIIAIDKVGQRSSPVEGFIRYASCGSGGTWGVNGPSEVYPGMIQPDLLFEGAAQLSFNVDFEYYGPGTNAYITDISFTDKELSITDAEDFAPSQVLDPASGCQVYPPGGTDSKAYVVCNMNRYPPERFRNVTAAYEKLEEMSSLTFPLKMILNYEYIDTYGNRQNKVQETCMDIEIFLDRRLPPDKIPEGLLNDSVEILTDTIETIDSILKPLHTITLATTGVCLATHLVLFFQVTALEYNCLGMQGDIPKIEQLLRGADDDTDTSTFCSETSEEGDRAARISGNEDQCDACVAAVKEMLSLRSFYSQVCDRIMCPSTPTGQKYINDVNKNSVSRSSSACSDSEDNPYSEFAGPVEDTEKFTREKGCGKEYYDEWSSSCLIYSIGGDDIVKASQNLNNGKNGTGVQSFLNRLNNLDFCKMAEGGYNESFIYRGDAYLYDGGKECHVLAEDPYQEIIKTGGPINDPSGKYENGDLKFKPYTKFEGKESRCVGTQEGKLVFLPTSETGEVLKFDAQAMDERPVIRVKPTGSEQSQEVQWLGNKQVDGKWQAQFVGRDGKYHQMPYDGDTTIDANTPPRDTQLDGFRSGRLGAYKHDDIYRGEVDGEVKYLTESEARDQSLKNRKSTTKTTTLVDKDGKPMKDPKTGKDIISKEKTEDTTIADSETKIDSNRFKKISGPDKLTGDEVPDYLIDSKASLINSLRCVCLPAISGYLQTIRNILSAIRNCLQGVLVTKEFKSGMCKAVLTQYLCDWIFEAIGCIVKASGKNDAELSNIEASTGRVDPITRTLSALGRSGSRVNSYASGRYGETGTFNALFTQRKLLHMVCLAAFGYDWLPELDAAVNMNGEGFAINSTAMVFPATRRFMSANPFQQGQATFNYHIGYFLAAGDDVNYRLELVCSADMSCNDKYGFEGGRCDCSWGAGGKQPTNYPNVQNMQNYNANSQNQIDASRNYYSGVPQAYAQSPQYGYGERIVSLDAGFIKAGDTLAEGKGEIYRSVMDTVRYDKVRFCWTPTRSTDGGGQPGCVETKISPAGDLPPAQCTFDMRLMQFGCEHFIKAIGDVYFASTPTMAKTEVYEEDDIIQIDANIKIEYQDDKPETDRTPKYIVMEVKDQNGQPIGRVQSYKSFLSRPKNPKRFPTSTDKRIIKIPKSGGYSKGRTQLLPGAGKNGKDSFPRLFGASSSGTFESKTKIDIKLDIGSKDCTFIRYSREEVSTPPGTTVISKVANWGSGAGGKCKYESTTGRVSFDGDKNSIISFLVLDSVKSAKKGIFGNIIYYDNKETSLECPIGQAERTVQWTALITLHDAAPLNSDQQFDWENSRMSHVIATYNGAVMKKEIKFNVVCEFVEGEDDEITERNVIREGDGGFMCGPKTCAVKYEPKVGPSSVSYCSKDDEEYVCSIARRDFKTCSDIGQEGSIIISGEGCWCADNIPKKTTGLAYCDKDQICKKSDGRYFCEDTAGSTYLKIGDPIDKAQKSYGANQVTETQGGQTVYYYTIKSTNGKEYNLYVNIENIISAIMVKGTTTRVDKIPVASAPPTPVKK
jgi:hypothetical protein